MEIRRGTGEGEEVVNEGLATALLVGRKKQSEGVRTFLAWTLAR